MRETVLSISRQNDIGKIFRIIRQYSQNLGAARYSYHFTPIFESQTSASTFFNTEGFSPQWVVLYQDETFRACDPVPEYVMARAEPVLWAQAASAILAKGPNEKVREFFRESQKHGLEHGISIPSFGPRNRHAYTAFGFDNPVDSIDDERCIELSTIMQTAHLRISALLDKRAGPVTLSAREKEVLERISQGKSNAEIAEMLGISSDTVTTYVRRVFTKLDANDRVGAAIKALRLGLIRL